MNSHEQWMQLALDEAAKGIGRTAPNPPVGAVIVRQDHLLGKGYHHQSGQPHAERMAIQDAIKQHGSEALKGATLYITLEPCSTFGRTPPCTQAIIDAGIREVIYACMDPNPKHVGNANKILQEQGIAVQYGILEQEATRMIRPFTKAVTTGLPWVLWKVAMSMDGKITRPPHESQWLSSATSLEKVQWLRSQVDGIMTSGATVRADKPSLTIRQPDLLIGRTQPKRIIFTKHPDTLPRDAPLMHDELHQENIIFSDGDLKANLQCLVRDYNIHFVMLEAGGVLAQAMMELQLIDEVALFLTPWLCGGAQTPLQGSFLPQALPVKIESSEHLHPDFVLRGTLKPS